MPAIYTTDWYDALRELLNRNPDLERSAPRGRFGVLAEIRGDARSPYLADGERRFFAIHFDDGKCTGYRELHGSPPHKDFDFIFEIPATIFEGVAARTVDPVDAGLKGTIRITGDMRVLIKHADLVNVVYDVYSREIETSWPKGKPPYDE